MTVHPKFQGVRIKPGLYLQPHDDGETYSVIAKVLTPQDPKDKMMWWHGDISRPAIEVIQRKAGNPFVDDHDLYYEIESFADQGPWDTKREAIESALGLVAR